MKVIILYFIFISFVYSETIYMVTDFGQDKNKEAFFHKVANDFTKKKKDTVKFINIIDKDSYLREVDFKFLLYKSQYTPDIFSPTENIISKRIDVGLNLRTYFNFNKLFQPIVLSLIKDVDSNKYVFFPLEIASYFVFYNKRIFREKNMDLLLLDRRPYYKVFMIILNRIDKDKRDITPFVLGAIGDDIDNVSKFIDNILLMLIGPDKFKKYLEGKLHWNDKSLKLAFRYICILNSYNIVNSDFMEISDLEARKRFKEKKAAMYLGSTSFLSSEYQPSKFGLFPMFYTDLFPESVKSKNYFLLEIGSSLCINKYSEHLDESINFLKFLSSRKYSNLWSNEVKTLMALKNYSMGAKARKVYSYLNNGKDIIYRPIFREISNEYYLDIIDFYSKILSKKISKWQVNKYLEEFHKKVEENGWYR